ncbi:Type 1 glutamine amidotransferase-like domain-containing protein [Clostridium sp. D2Q-11]|uniref:Type 1 glutamine amidotransferase-like domain-containing protein n=1 Tax=Anaeromonas frigoriresistens TaxID=2683708 RepID=A0A942UZW1_9FIRM|nr:Type 1 glutamine amidotransferase-like domain-containing protein [Anaeromonas frigoriresistens]MBS4537512.1 Type 1 glutamine amidotransferase-like domain-containing protein [Anaeromonas frigoriresistens]
MLVFHSDQLDSNKEIDKRVLEIMGKGNPKFGYIPSCADIERTYYNLKKDYYKSLGVDLDIYFDLDQEYDSSKIDRLLECDAIFLSGGNTYYFMNNIRKRKFGKVLEKFHKKGGVIIGVSAGAMVLTSSIESSNICGDINDTNLENSDGLNFVNFDFVPHLNIQSNMIEELKKYSLDNKSKKIFVCNDGSGLIINNNKIEIIGDVYLTYNGDLIPMID